MPDMITLSPDTLEAINAALETAKVLKSEIKRAQAAGIQLDITIEQVEAQERQLRAIKQVYFPTGKSAG